MLKIMFYTPFLLQGLCMFFDELYFHRKRGLGLWERIGHPLDTITVLACFAFLYLRPYTESNLITFVLLSFFSCLFVTKDEFVHSQFCEPAENWLHSLLFILHPICFLSAGFLWKSAEAANFIFIQCLVLVAVLFYQIIYWSFLCKKTLT